MAKKSEEYGIIEANDPETYGAFYIKDLVDGYSHDALSGEPLVFKTRSAAEKWIEAERKNPTRRVGWRVSDPPSKKKKAATVKVTRDKSLDDPRLLNRDFRAGWDAAMKYAHDEILKDAKKKLKAKAAKAGGR